LPATYPLHTRVSMAATSCCGGVGGEASSIMAWRSLAARRTNLALKASVTAANANLGGGDFGNSEEGWR